MRPEEMKTQSRGFSVDMTPESIEKRINKVSKLRVLCKELGKAKILGYVEKKEQKQ